MLTFMFRMLGRKSASKGFAGSNEILRWFDRIFPSKYGPQNGVQNWITFSFLLLGLCLGPVLGSRFGPKSGASQSENFAAARRCFASKFATHKHDRKR